MSIVCNNPASIFWTLAAASHMTANPAGAGPLRESPRQLVACVSRAAAIESAISVRTEGWSGTTAVNGLLIEARSLNAERKESIRRIYTKIEGIDRGLYVESGSEFLK